MTTETAINSSLSENRSTALLAVGLIIVIVMMVLPVPSIVLDLGLTISFALAVLIFTTTLFIERPLDFSAFPTVLLGALILRLSLNISSTKLIIGSGHAGTDAAGGVIEGFAMFIMGGNFFLGIVVFCVLLIVNFMVITKGAGRMAEVGARFALDAMPGKQLAIDSDVAAGAISHQEAVERRRIEQEETTFFGSLDGASKFVKGDAIAGLLITILNLVAGLAIGVGAHGLSVADAASTYAILTVGDGLVSQIPAVIISVATALLLSKGGVAGSADKAVFKQLGASPIALGTVGVVLAAFAFLPGLPFTPFMLGAGGVFAAAYFSQQGTNDEKTTEIESTELKHSDEKALGDILDVDELHLEFASNLTPIVMDDVLGLDARIAKIRRFIAEEYGFVAPPVRLTDNLEMDANAYGINVQGIRRASGQVQPNRLLVITDDLATLPVAGVDAEEPVYGAQARWIAVSDRDVAAAAGLTVIEPAEIIITHLLETIKSNFRQLMTRRALQRIFDEFTSVSDPSKAVANRRIVDDFIPEKIASELVQGVFSNLLDELVPIRNIPLLLESIADAAAQAQTPEQATEFVRRKIAPAFIFRYLTDAGILPLIQIDLNWEDIFREHEFERPNGVVDVALPPEKFNELTLLIQEQVSRARAQGAPPVIVTTSHRRRFVRELVNAKKISAHVLCYDEIDARMQMSIIGKI